MPGDTGWRTVRVRAGSAIIRAALPIPATGTDGVNIPDDINDIPAFNASIDVTLPDAAASYWVWLEITMRDNQTPLVTVCNDATSTTPTEWSRTVRPIAQVHIDPQSQTLRVDQIVRGDVFEFRI